MAMKSDFEISPQWKKHLKITKDGLSKQYKNTEKCQAFYAGNMMDFWIGAQSTDGNGGRRRAMVQINKVKPYVNAIKGFFAQNRKRPKYSALMEGNQIQQLYSMYANGMSDYIRRKAFADPRETQQDGDMLINGYGAIENHMTYTNGQSTTDPNGRIIMGRLDPLTVGWDPAAKETNLIDARWVFSEQIYSLDDAIDLFQDSKEDDFESATDTSLMDGDAGYKYYAKGGRYNKIKETNLDWSDEKNERVKVYFYQWYQFEPFFRCENPAALLPDPLSKIMAQNQLELLAQEFAEEDDDLFQFDPKAEILNFGPKIKAKLIEIFGNGLEIYEYRRKCFYTAVISRDHIFTKFKNASQQGFTIKFKTGDYDATNKIWTGFVNSLMEPTLLYNKGLTELLFIIGSNSKGGVYIEEDAVDDPELFEQQYSKTDAVITVAPGAISGNKIKPKKEGQSLTGYEQVVERMDADITDVGGVDKAIFGSTENRDESGVLFKRRIKQAMAVLAGYVDAIDLYLVEDAQIKLDMMRIWAENNSGGLFSIIGPDGREKFLTISANKLAPLYDVKIDEAPQTEEEKQEFATILGSIAEKLLLAQDAATAKAVYSIAVKYLPLDPDDQKQLSQILMPPSQPIDPKMVEALQKQIEELTSQLTIAHVAETKSKTLLNNSRARLEVAKIPVQAATVTEKKASAVSKLHGEHMDAHRVQIERSVAQQPQATT